MDEYRENAPNPSMVAVALAILTASVLDAGPSMRYQIHLGAEAVVCVQRSGAKIVMKMPHWSRFCANRAMQCRIRPVGSVMMGSVGIVALPSGGPTLPSTEAAV